jgi:signal transduction histidine kinase
MEGIKRQKSFGRIFAVYIISFCVTAIILALVIFGIFAIAVNKGVVLPANYYEQYIEQRRNDIAEAKNVETIIPKECIYVVFNVDGKMVQGNMTEKEALEIWSEFQNNTSNGKYFYKIIQRTNEICIVQYSLVAKFSNTVLQKYISNAENCFFLLYVILFIAEIIVFSRCFSRRLLKEMQILKDTTKNIQMENLDFQIENSNIIEINEVLFALEKMKKELQQSLSKQWKMEETRKEQLAALAHDIKTPLTIVRGNAELLNELELDSEQRAFTKNILAETEKMEFYIKSLIDIMKSEREAVIARKQIELVSFIKDIVETGHSMTREKEIAFISNIEKVPRVFLGDEMALHRAIINVISNAVEYTPINGEILFNVYTNNKSIRFIIEDSGRGFTLEELNYATEQFFQGDKSRNSKNHYGMGLYIAKEFLRKHNGTITLENSERLSGARVTLEMPVV